jgi:hypothetical protein
MAVSHQQRHATNGSDTKQGAVMKAFSYRQYLYTAALLVLIGSTAHAATLYVNCGARSGGGAYSSIGAALKALKGSEGGGANTINVTGACYENVLITDAIQLTITGTNGASITDLSGDRADVVDIRNSRVTITGMTIDAKSGVYWDAVDCEQGSHCTLVGNTIQGGADAVGVYTTASAIITGGVLQKATSAGIWATGEVAAAGVLIQGNPLGIGVTKGGRASATIADPAWSPPVRAVTPTTLANNGAGVQVFEGAQFRCAGCIIRDNGGDGIHVDVSATAAIQVAYPSNGSVLPPSITRNTGYGVYVGDLSSAAFHGPMLTVTGNGLTDVWCNATLSVSRGAVGAAGGPTHTNCTN